MDVRTDMPDSAGRECGELDMRMRGSSLVSLADIHVSCRFTPTCLHEGPRTFTGLLSREVQSSCVYMSMVAPMVHGGLDRRTFARLLIASVWHDRQADTVHFSVSKAIGVKI